MVAGKGDLGKATGHAFQGVRQVVARPNLGIRRTYAETKNAAQAKFKRGRSLGGSMESARRSADARKMATPTGQGPTQVHHRMASAYRSGLGGPGGLSRQILRQRPDGLTRRPAQPEGSLAGPQRAIQKRLLDLRSGETLMTRQGYQHPFSTAPRAPSPAPAATSAPKPEVKAVEDLFRPAKTSLNAGEIQHLLSNRYQ
jgi:hypothetical protein